MLTLRDLRDVEVRRRGQGRMYDLAHVVLCCILAVAAGADSYRAIVRFIDVRLGWLQQHTALAWRRAPSHTGLRSILLGLDQSALEQALRRRAKAAEVAPASIAIDGKTLRGSLDRFAAAVAVGLCHRPAPGARAGVALADGDKGGEIAAAQQLIEELGL